MRTVAGTIFITLLLLQTFSKGITVLGFLSNQSYIAATSCINKATPLLKCNGKCQLVKKLSAEEKENQSSKTNNKNILLDQLFINASPTIVNELISAKRVFSFHYPPVKTTSFTTRIFHPPSC